MSRETRADKLVCSAFFLFQKWHHLSSGWPETMQNSTTWLNYFRSDEFSNQTGVKIARHPRAEAFFPWIFAAAASDPCTCAGCLSQGWLCGTHAGRAWLFCRRQWGASHSPGSPMSPELPSWSCKMLCVNKQTCVWMKKKTEISLTLLVHGAPSPP